MGSGRVGQPAKSPSQPGAHCPHRRWTSHWHCLLTDRLAKVADAAFRRHCRAWYGEAPGYASPRDGAHGPETAAVARALHCQRVGAGCPAGAVKRMAKLRPGHAEGPGGLVPREEMARLEPGLGRDRREVDHLVEGGISPRSPMFHSIFLFDRNWPGGRATLRDVDVARKCGSGLHGRRSGGLPFRCRVQA